ncbi:hypothetical protein S40293_06661 [Stachybotrys chartarum IBT 40293]|nr:hypothetical protein S40293_06661 [Stachybotrys chartarum IBT 40293]
MAPTLEAVRTDAAPAPLPVFSQAIKANGMVYLSGNIGLDPKTSQVVEGTVKDRARQTLKNMSAVLEASGSSLHSVVKINIYITSMANFALVNEAYQEFFTWDPKPARTCVAVFELPFGTDVEIESKSFPNPTEKEERKAKIMAEISDQELADIHAFAVQLGKDAGDMLMRALQQRMAGDRGDGRAAEVQYVLKENAVDIVTKTDNEVEAFIHKSISERYPSHDFIGEESYSAGTSRRYLVASGPTWIVDPLDGTVNFTHIFPMFCVSIAFAVRGRPVIGVVNAPFLHQLFTSCAGRGAWLNETQRLPLVRNPTPCMPADAPGGCTFSCEWGKDRRDVEGGNMMRKVESFVTMAAERGGRGGKGGMVHGVRSLGSATLDLAYTAMGSFDIWWEGGCWEWDVAAGFALLEEAGGLITTANPPDDPETAPIPEAHLGSRLYLAIRPAGPGANETGRQSQERTVREVWKRVQTLDYKRPEV